MSESNPTLSQQLFDFCYSLYLDPIYRYICFPPEEVTRDATFSKEQFVNVWQAVSHERAEVEPSGMKQALARVIETVGALNPVEQTVLLMRYGADLPYKEIAKLVKRSESACHVIHYRALSEFCERLDQRKDYGHV